MRFSSSTNSSPFSIFSPCSILIFMMGIFDGIGVGGIRKVPLQYTLNLRRSSSSSYFLPSFPFSYSNSKAKVKSMSFPENSFSYWLSIPGANIYNWRYIPKYKYKQNHQPLSITAPLINSNSNKIVNFNNKFMPILSTSPPPHFTNKNIVNSSTQKIDIDTQTSTTSTATSTSAENIISSTPEKIDSDSFSSSSSTTENVESSTSSASGSGLVVSSSSSSSPTDFDYYEEILKDIEDYSSSVPVPVSGSSPVNSSSISSSSEKETENKTPVPSLASGELTDEEYLGFLTWLLQDGKDKDKEKDNENNKENGDQNNKNSTIPNLNFRINTKERRDQIFRMRKFNFPINLIRKKIQEKFLASNSAPDDD